jgi:hypothetical protein
MSRKEAKNVLTLEEYQEYVNEKEGVVLTTIMKTLTDIQLQIDDLTPETEDEDEDLV